MRIKANAKIITLFVLLAFLMSAVGAYGGKVQLPEETKIKIKFDPNMKISSGKLQKGIPLLIYLAEDIQVGGKTIIEAGAEGKAEVLEVEQAGTPGKPGYIKIGFIELSPKGEYGTLDGSPILISGEAVAKGGSKKLLSYVFIFGLFIKGGQGEIDVTKVYDAQINETVIMQSE